MRNGDPERKDASDPPTDTDDALLAGSPGKKLKPVSPRRGAGESEHPAGYVGASEDEAGRRRTERAARRRPGKKP
jgi:hypothetical protein